MGYHLTTADDVEARLFHPPARTAKYTVVQSKTAWGPIFKWVLCSKYTDSETELIYFGLRFYTPETGRWTNRDPVGEHGGVSIYGFVHNSVINLIDAIGLSYDIVYDATDNVIDAMRHTVERGRYWRPTSYMRDELINRTEDASRSLDCGCPFPWVRTTCTVRGTYRNTSLPAIIYMSIWFPVRSPTPDEQAAFDDIYSQVLQHEQEHNAIDESYFAQLNATFVGQGSVCSVFSGMACSVAQNKMIEAHDANFQRVMRESAQAQFRFEFSDAHRQFTSNLYDLINAYARSL